MQPDQIFSICNSIVLPGWFLLVFLPRWRWTQRIAAILLPLLLAVVYLLLIAIHFRPGQGGFGSLAEVARLFTNPNLLLAGWIHYLAFDLFIGSWEVRDAIRNRISSLIVWPCILLTFMFGPIGLLSYMLLRAALRRQLEIAD
jgi:hypothetical protein